jgi:general stress protein 26
MPAEPTAELQPDFSSPGATARPWAEVEEVLTGSEMFWLATVRGDGRPHAAPLPCVWDGGALHFCTGPAEQKAVNLRYDARCLLATGTRAQHDGLDVVVEGSAERVTDHDRLVTLAGLWKTKLDWDFTAEADHFVHPVGAGRADVFAVRPDKVLAFGKGEPFSQTRYTFPG